MFFFLWWLWFGRQNCSSYISVCFTCEIGDLITSMWSTDHPHPWYSAGSHVLPLYRWLCFLKLETGMLFPRSARTLPLCKQLIAWRGNMRNWSIHIYTAIAPAASVTCWLPSQRSLCRTVNESNSVMLIIQFILSIMASLYVRFTFSFMLLSLANATIVM